MKNKFAIALVVLLLGNFPALPSHAEICEGNYCQISFALTSQIEQFNIPIGVTSIDFEIAGASGGRGGQGGKVTGTLTNLPDKIYIVVGGQGEIGSQVNGGFNGGGKAGGFRTNEGSGGGASDIRLDLGLDSRIVVAGGGGGGGGFSGAPGGAGGGEIGGWGQSGQGGGGGGGTQTAGGTPGTSNGGSQATAGSFGVGGTGGNSMNAGGGGGGGGWYGGGGGGADDDNCCSDGGGGGGGSSYAHPNYTNNIVHQQGGQLGNGYVTLSYTRNLVVTSFTAYQLDKDTAIFDLGLSMPTELALSNFDLSALFCEQIDLEPTAAGFRVIATGCPSGEQSVRLEAGALDGVSPAAELSAGVLFDATAPVFTWQSGVVNHQSNQIQIPYFLDEGALLADQLIVVGCDEVLITAAEISLQSCMADEASVSIPIGTFADLFGNAAPAEVMTQSFSFDQIAPTVEHANLVINPETAQHSFELLFSEQVSFDVNRILIEPSGCQPEMQSSENSVLISSSCGFGDFSYVFPALAAADLVGNLGPAGDYLVTVSIAEPAEPEEPSVELQPTTPESTGESNPAATPADLPSDPSDNSASEGVDEVASTPDVEQPSQQAPLENDANRQPRLAPEPTPMQQGVEPTGELSVQTETIEPQEALSGPQTLNSAIERETSLPVERTDDAGLEALTITATSQPRLSSDPLNASPNLNLLLITAGGFGVLATTGYLIYRKMMVR